MEVTKLGEILKIQHGYAFKSNEYVDKSNYRLVTLGNFEEGNNSFKYNDAKATYYGADFPDEYVLQEWDLVMPLTEQVVGLFGNSAFIPKEERFKFVLNQRVGKVICNEDRLDKIYAHYLLATNSVKNQLEARASGTRQRNISPDDVYDVTVELPSLDEQKIIGKILFSIEQKQELNNSICSDLESMAKLLYDYWFVQFDFPDENGRPYKSSGGKMVWNDEMKREIPEGWEVQPLSHFIAYSKNGDWGNEKSKKTSDICVNCFRGADFASITNDYHMTAPVRYISAKNKDRLLSDGDLVTEISGGSPTQATGRIGYINKGFLDRSENDMTCSNFCKAFTPYDKSYQYWLYQTWKFLYDIGAMFNYESKTTGIKNLMFDEFVAWNKVPEPNRELALLYQKESDLYYGKIQSLLIENQELASLRDFLLPMLMNGQIKIEDVKAS